MSHKLYLVESLKIGILFLVRDNLFTEFLAPLNLSFLTYKIKELTIVIPKLSYILEIPRQFLDTQMPKFQP